MPISDLRTIPKKLTPKGGRYRRAQPPSMAACADVQPLAVAGAAFDAGCQWPCSPSVGRCAADVRLGWLPRWRDAPSRRRRKAQRKEKCKKSHIMVDMGLKTCIMGASCYFAPRLETWT